MPDPTPPPKKPGAGTLINERHAKLIGDLLVEAATQINRASKVLEGSALIGDGTFIRPTGGHIKYDLEIEIRRDVEDGLDKVKTSKLTIDQDLEVVRPPESLSPLYSLVLGAFASSEKNRTAIEAAITRAGLPAKGSVILTLQEGKYWVKTQNGPHLVVEFNGMGDGIVRAIKDLDSLDKETKPLFKFLSDQVIKL